MTCRPAGIEYEPTVATSIIERRLFVPENVGLIVTKQELVDYATLGYDDYSPNEDVCARLEQVRLVTVSGPRGIGKDTTCGATEYDEVCAFTTRDIRAGEIDGQDYDFVPTEHYGYLIQAIREGRLVQYSMGVSGDEVYGTLASRYSTDKPAVLDIMYKELAKMRELPFKSLTNIFLVSPFRTWIPRWQGRGQMTNQQIYDSYVEAENALSCALQDEGIVFLNNTTPKRTASTLRGVVERPEGYSTKRRKAARAVGEQLLIDIRQKLEDLIT